MALHDHSEPCKFLVAMKRTLLDRLTPSSLSRLTQGGGCISRYRSLSAHDFGRRTASAISSNGALFPRNANTAYEIVRTASTKKGMAGVSSWRKLPERNMAGFAQSIALWLELPYTITQSRGEARSEASR